LREFTRSADDTLYGAPHRASASALISVSMNVDNKDRNTSGDADCN
jgi:hypothetical protein